MSKRLGNGIDPFETIDKYGADATRWYMISNAAPWDNLKFDMDGLVEVQRKFFGTLYNTYTFFALYANIDGFEINENDITPVQARAELDQWIISALQKLILEVEESYENYEPHRAARAIQYFVDEHLSNWYVRLSRRRFWKGELTADKKAAYETLFECLTTISQLMSPVAPFFAEWLYKNLTDTLREKGLSKDSKFEAQSIHLSYLTGANTALINEGLNESMLLAQNISSMVLSLRKKVSINVRQPLSRILIPSLGKEFEVKVEAIKHLILSETNIKNIEYLTDSHGFIHKKIKPNFKALGAKVGKDMKEVAAALTALDQNQILEFEKNGQYTLENNNFVIDIADVEIVAEDIPGWLVNVMGNLTVALDVSISEELRLEGLAREIINRIQNLRKDKGFEVTDKIQVKILDNDYIKEAINKNLNYICAEILATQLSFVAGDLLNKERVEINEKEVYISIEKDS